MKILLSLMLLMAQAGSGQDGEEIKVTVRSVHFVPLGMFVDDPKYIVAIVNDGDRNCYAVSPPFGVTVFVGKTYLLIEDDEIGGMAKEYLLGAYPRCVLVKEAPQNPASK